MTMSATNPWPALLNVLIEPRTAITDLLKQKRSWWIPILVSLVAAESFWLWYYSSVDFAWLKDLLLDASNPSVDPEQRAAMANLISLKVQLWSTLIGVVVVLLFTTVLQAGYLLVVSKVEDDDDTGFLDWFNLVAWAGMPRVLVTVMAAVLFAISSSHQVAPTSLNPVSLNALIFRLPLSSPWAGLTNSLDVTMVWSIALIGVGYAIRKNTSTTRGMLVAFLPYVLIYGIWALVKLKA